jgi:transcriptional regulator with XRE-family HTH domain
VTSQFSVLLKQLRRETELTQEDLAERSGLSVRTIRRLETGESANPQLDTVRLLADALSLKPDARAQMLAVADGHAIPEPPSESPSVNGNQPESAFERRLAEAADDLAHAVGARWGREEELRRIQDPFPLPVRWQLAPDNVMDHWENIRRTPAGESAKPLDLSGQLPEIAEIYRRIPSGRLVVLGRAGSGKSVLAVRFVLDLLKTRHRGGPVPVLFSLASWNPNTTGFRDWLAGQLVRDHPGLATTRRNGTNLATALVEAGRILPVLDGFDELAAGLHRAALDALNVTTLPLLLTSRPGEYATVANTDALTAAAAVRLTDLTVSDLAGYLPRTTRGANGATVWDPVLDELRNHPERPASVNLRAVLTTPLMVGLARAIYSDPAGLDPMELLDTKRFSSQYALEDHLLGSFIPTVYRDHRARWDAERVRGWLGYLAQHLDRLGAHDIAWWELGNSVRRSARMVIVGLVSGLGVALISGLVIFLTGWPGAGFERGLTDGMVAALENWLGFGLALGLAHGAGLALGGGAFEPARVRLRTHGGARQLRARFRPRLTVGVAGGIGLGLVLGLAVATGLNPLGLDGFGVAGAVATGVGLGVLAGLIWGLAAGLEAPIDVRSAVSPAVLLKTNRWTVVPQFLGWGLILGLVHLLVVVLAAEHVDRRGFVFAPVLGPMVGLAIGVSLTAWGQWLIFARVWLPLTGRLPWTVGNFLEDACRRGVLRQVGAVYQFRHARLQTHLTNPG